MERPGRSAGTVVGPRLFETVEAELFAVEELRELVEAQVAGP